MRWSIRPAGHPRGSRCRPTRWSSSIRASHWPCRWRTLGEIGIAGIGLAKGYVKRDDLTDKAFISDFLGIANNPSRPDLPHRGPRPDQRAGEIEYFGRIDTQVKIRGYRIELTEIESVLLRFPGSPRRS